MSDLEEIRHARIYLTRAAQQPAPHLNRLVANLGAVAVAELVRGGDAPAAVAAELHEDHRTVRVRDTDFTGPHNDVRVIIPEETDLWPATQFHAGDLHDDDSRWVAPLALWTRGSATLPDLWTRSVSVTGSRAATQYGLVLAADLGYQLAEQEITVTTGASFGIEGAAACGAGSGGGPVVAVLPCGIDIAYPSAHQQLLDRISSNGAVISSFPPGVLPQLGRFGYRTCMLAAASQVLVIVEASVRSGSLAAARHATTMRRTVMAVPGPITSAASAGSNGLLRDSAAVAVANLREVGDRFEHVLRSSSAASDATC